MTSGKSKSGADLLETMMLIRAFEERNRVNQASGKAAGTCTSVGQEASAVGVVTALSAEDQILTNHPGGILIHDAQRAKFHNNSRNVK